MNLLNAAKVLLEHYNTIGNVSEDHLNLLQEAVDAETKIYNSNLNKFEDNHLFLIDTSNWSEDEIIEAERQITVAMHHD